ncbi:MAG: hypothetical protein NTY35_01970 [Planctomycetota bacterium]|nr:hypothetical protein [Planctomycetota bacterium]
MVRVRLVTTPIWSQDHLLRALAQVGFPNSESHHEAVPLSSWRGIPLGGEAHVVVRRDKIGSAGDDFGFVRNARGSFDAVVSEIHFNRFDRRWLEDLTRRHDELVRADGRTPPADLPTTWEKRELGTAPAPLLAPGTVAPTAKSLRAEAATQLHQQHTSRARAETAVALDELRKMQKKSDGLGCVLSLLLPIVLWIILSVAEPSLRGAPGFFGVVLPLWFVLAIVRVVRMARRAKTAASALMARLPSGEHGRSAALAYLETKLKPVGAKTEDALVKELLKALSERRN